MAAKWALSEDTKKKIAELSSEVTAEVEQLRGEFDDQSERWQDSDKGLDVGAWLDELDNLAQSLDDVQEEA